MIKAGDIAMIRSIPCWTYASEDVPDGAYVDVDRVSPSAAFDFDGYVLTWPKSRDNAEVSPGDYFSFNADELVEVSQERQDMVRAYAALGGQGMVPDGWPE